MILGVRGMLFRSEPSRVTRFISRSTGYEWNNCNGISAVGNNSGVISGDMLNYSGSVHYTVLQVDEGREMDRDRKRSGRPEENVIHYRVTNIDNTYYRIEKMVDKVLGWESLPEVYLDLTSAKNAKAILAIQQRYDWMEVE